MPIVIEPTSIKSFTNKGKDKIGGGGMDIGQTKKKKKKKKEEEMGLMGGGSLKMVTNDRGEKVPFYAADNKGKMMGGGKVKKYGGGGKVRGAGIARKGVRKCKYV
jgi:hypothetical protein